MLFTNEKFGCFAKDPAVVHYNGKYFLYHSTYCAELDRLGIGIAESTDMENWTVTGDLPLTQECEKNGVGAPAAIVLGGAVHLFYQTYGNREKDAICHAVSTDGVNFEKDAGNPVFRPSKDWCCGRAIDADICVFRGKLYMYFATRDHAYRIQKVGGAAAELDSGFGRGAWEQLAPQALISPELEWEQECIEGPGTIVNGDEIFMFYGGAYNCKPQQVGVASSRDGVFFTRVFTEPFLRPGKSGEWNGSESGHPYAFRDDDGRAYLFYQGSPDMGKTWYLSKVEIGFDGENKPYIIG